MKDMNVVAVDWAATAPGSHVLLVAVNDHAVKDWLNGLGGVHYVAGEFRLWNGARIDVSTAVRVNHKWQSLPDYDAVFIENEGGLTIAACRALGGHAKAHIEPELFMKGAPFQKIPGAETSNTATVTVNKEVPWLFSRALSDPEGSVTPTLEGATASRQAGIALTSDEISILKAGLYRIGYIAHISNTTRWRSAMRKLESAQSTVGTPPPADPGATEARSEDVVETSTLVPLTQEHLLFIVRALEHIDFTQPAWRYPFDQSLRVNIIAALKATPFSVAE